MKLPKQFYHWLEQCRIKPIRSKRKSKYYFKGWDRYFRVNAYMQFEISEPIADFDRWANSVEMRFDMPTSEQEMHFILDEFFRSLANDTDHQTK